MTPIRSKTICAGIAIAVSTLLATAQTQVNPEEPGFGDDPRVSKGPIAPELSGLGNHTMDITTDSEKAQQFFNQGLMLTYAFNHAEAKRAFQEAIRLDNECAMAYWGWALVMGPNINRPMPADEAPEAYKAIQQALALSAGVSEKERDLIDALAKRYTQNPEDRAANDAAYSAAMEQLYAKYSDDPDIGTLYAASVMDLMPWAYWSKDGRPRPQTQQAMDILEGVSKANPEHTGAHHYYIHIVEEHYPEKAEWASDQLIKLAPGSGHLTHMPSHIYMRIGRYDDAFESNRMAVEADEGYLTACRQQGIYPQAYYPHNIHFLMWAAQREGRSADAIAQAMKVGQKALQASDIGADFALHQSFLSQPMYAMVRFGKWDDILKQPTPDNDKMIARGIHHFARGMAFLNTGKTKQAKKELESLQTAMNSDSALQDFVGFANGKTILQLAEGVLAGEIAAKAGDIDGALARLETAVRIEDAMMYNEPPDWPIPTRHTLGAVLLDAGRPLEAESVYWQDLNKNPNNGFALFGLRQALLAQGKSDAAADIEARLQEVWDEADFEATSSRF